MKQKRSMRRLKAMGIMSVLVVAISVAVYATGCGKNDTSASKSANTTTKSISQEVSSSSEEDTKSKSQEETMSQEEWEEYAKSDEYKLKMDEQSAGQNAIEGAIDQIGEGDWRIVSSEKSVSPGDGFECWKVGVVNYANAQSPTYYFYCGDQFCIME